MAVVPVNATTSPARTAREYPTFGSQGVPVEILIRSSLTCMVATMLRRGIARNALLAIALFTSACGDDAERPAPGPAPEVPGDLVEVTRVVDGDTIRVLLDGYEERVRYIGVNTPEVRDPFGDEATRANRRLDLFTQRRDRL